LELGDAVQFPSDVVRLCYVIWCDSAGCMTRPEGGEPVDFSFSRFGLIGRLLVFACCYLCVSAIGELVV
jgi:hypothetical protein